MGGTREQLVVEGEQEREEGLTWSTRKVSSSHISSSTSSSTCDLPSASPSPPKHRRARRNTSRMGGVWDRGEEEREEGKKETEEGRKRGGGAEGKKERRGGNGEKEVSGRRRRGRRDQPLALHSPTSPTHVQLGGRQENSRRSTSPAESSTQDPAEAVQSSIASSAYPPLPVPRLLLLALVPSSFLLSSLYLGRF
eukprot:752783-Hanusia_phi.AAC.4